VLKGGVAKLFCRWKRFVKEYLVHFAKGVKEALDGRNSLRGIRTVLRAVRSCRGEGELW
jgi:hypothetical protein